MKCSDAFGRLRPLSPGGELRLHNDDVHSFEEVVQALESIGVRIPDPKRIAMKAHELGSVQVRGVRAYYSSAKRENFKHITLS